MNKQFKISKQKMLEIATLAKNYEHPLIDWYPTIEEIKSNIDLNDPENIPFLSWLCNTELELTKDEEETKSFIRNFLSEKVLIKEEV